jgi:hypothetical protein
MNRENIRYSRIANIIGAMSLKPQDIVVCLKLATWPDEKWRFETLAFSLGLSVSETHAAIQRLRWARLLDGTVKRPLRRNLLEMLIGGVKYFYVARIGGQVTGVPTGISASPLKEHFADKEMTPFVWPHPEGTVYGHELTPLYRTVPMAALQDPQLYELLVLVDALRLHSPRPTALAAELLRKKIGILSADWHLNMDRRFVES